MIALPEDSAIAARTKRSNGRRAAVVLLLSALVSALIFVLWARRESPRPRNVIIVFVDTLNRSALRAYDPDAIELPAIDAFSRRSAIYEHAYSTSSWTLPAYATLLSGLNPHEHGVVHVARRLQPEVVTLASILRGQGFENSAFTDGGFTSMAYGFGSGFDRYNAWIDPESDAPSYTVPRAGKAHETPGQGLFDRGIAFLRTKSGQQSKDAGFFLLLHTYGVHDYFRLRRWAIESLSVRAKKSADHYVGCVAGFIACPPEDWDVLRALYRAELQHLDEGFARLLTTLEETGLRDSTLVIFLSDHGEGFDPVHSRIHHGGRLHQDLVRIPLMMAGPGIDSKRVAAPVSLIDILPTVADLLDVPLPHEVSGMSIAPGRMADALPPGRVLYAAEYFHYWENGARTEVERVPKEPLAVAIIQDDKWYIRTRADEELYYMQADPLQRRNLVNDSPATSEFRERADWKRFEIAPAPNFEIPEELTKQLESLGYLN